jgi:hypothetical protein
MTPGMWSDGIAFEVRCGDIFQIESADLYVFGIVIDERGYDYYCMVLRPSITFAKRSHTLRIEVPHDWDMRWP